MVPQGHFLKKINHLLISCVFPDLRRFWHFCHPKSSKIQQKIPKSSNQTKKPKILKNPKKDPNIRKKSNQNPKILRHPPKSNKKSNKNPKSSKNSHKKPQILRIPTKKPMARQPGRPVLSRCFSSSEAPDCDRVEVRYEQQSYDKMPGFFASILMDHLDVRLEVRFNGW